jgi:hypothetical protein
VLTHTHFDHALDVDLFSAAGVYVHESEAVNPEEQSLATKFAALSGQNRLHRVGHRIQVAEGLEAVHIGGPHTRFADRQNNGPRKAADFHGRRMLFRRRVRRGRRVTLGCGLRQGKKSGLCSLVARRQHTANGSRTAS